VITDDLTAAQRGDEQAFARLVAPHRAQLQAHCYRMLGSLTDAEDALQETLVRAWRGLPRFEGRSTLRGWLYRIATNVSLRALERRPRRLTPLDRGPANRDGAEPPGEAVTEPVWLEPFPDAELSDGLASPEARYAERESVELAFVAALQHLPERQRAVLLLRDVLGFAPHEIAELAGTSPAAIHSTLQRARRTAEERLPERSQQTTLRALGDRRLRELADRYVRAWERDDVDAIVALLSDDAAFAMPPLPGWYRGRDAVAAFLAARPLALPRRWRRERVGASGQLAFVTYGLASRVLPDGSRELVEDDELHGHGIELLTVGGDGRVAQVTAFLDPALVARFGLPATVAPLVG
jgi:RNA polymerase sigma-70 factor (ECF subfamily)